jgi:hypothetical protein
MHEQLHSEPGHASNEAGRNPVTQMENYEAPEVRNLGNAREVFLGSSSGSASDSFKAPNRSKSCM